MPEPVVIIGPAKGPAGPIGEPAEAADRAELDNTDVPPERQPKKGQGNKSMVLSALTRLGIGLFMLLARGLLTIAKVGISVARHNPRHSLAAGASLLILGAIWYTQHFSGTSLRPPVSVEIKAATSENKAASSTGSPALQKNAANIKTNGAAATAETIASKNPGAAGVAHPDDKLTAPPAAAHAEAKAAPASTLIMTDDAAPTLPPPLAGAPEAGQDSERAPKNAAPAADLAAAKPEPIPPASAADPSTPNLLEFATLDPAPPPSSVVKDDKKEEDAVKPAPAVEAPAPIAALVPSSSPLVEAAPAPAPAGDPFQLATMGDDQNKPSPASAPKPPPKSLASGSHQPASTTGETANAAVKPDEARAPAEPKTVMNPPDAPKTEPGTQSKTEPGTQSNPDISHPESTPSELVKSEPPQPKVEEPAPSSLGPADNLKAEPKTVMNPPDAHKTEPGPQSNADISHPESTPNELVKSQPPQPKNAKVEEPAPASLGFADNLKVDPVFPATPGVHVSGSEGAVTAKPPVESSAAPLETPAASAHNAPSQPTVPAPAPVKAAPPLESQAQIPDSSSQVAKSQPQISESREPDARPRSSRELASAGWVSVPNSGKVLFEDTTNADATRDASSSGVAAESAAIHDVRAHAAKDVSFELESPRARGIAELEQNSRRSVLGSGAATEPRSSSTAGRVEPNAHVVEKGENFWSISRLYYSSGRYYRALWKANADKYPEIDKLRVNDVIIVPAVEDLDPASIDPPRARAPASLGTARNSGDRSRGSRDNANGPAESSVSSSAATRGEPVSTARTNSDPGDAIPVRRSSRTDPDLDLPAPEAISRRDNAPDRTGRRVDRPLGDDDANDAPETRTAARPRATAVASKRRPVYKIRQYDTLRSIARDMLGDSHRSSEILDLNRDLIDDPAHLIVGQILELPDDARTSVRRSASR